MSTPLYKKRVRHYYRFHTSEPIQVKAGSLFRKTKPWHRASTGPIDVGFLIGKSALNPDWYHPSIVKEDHGVELKDLEPFEIYNMMKSVMGHYSGGVVMATDHRPLYQRCRRAKKRREESGFVYPDLKEDIFKDLPKEWNNPNAMRKVKWYDVG